MRTNGRCTPAAIPARNCYESPARRWRWRCQHRRSRRPSPVTVIFFPTAAADVNVKVQLARNIAGSRRRCTYQWWINPRGGIVYTLNRQNITLPACTAAIADKTGGEPINRRVEATSVLAVSHSEPLAVRRWTDSRTVWLLYGNSTMMDEEHARMTDEEHARMTDEEHASCVCD